MVPVLETSLSIAYIYDFDILEGSDSYEKECFVLFFIYEVLANTCQTSFLIL
jgi:hypothetical protein